MRSSLLGIAVLLALPCACSSGSSGGGMVIAADDVSEAGGDALFVRADAMPDGDTTDSPAGCCPLGSPNSGCLSLGGSRADNPGCQTVCDFFCSTNWHTVKDSHGCDTWAYDTRQPLPGENQYCFDAGLGSGVEAGTDSGPSTTGEAGSDSGHTGAACSGPSDCRTFSNYCGGCTCDALGTSAPDPTCDAGLGSCLVDPCSSHTAICDSTHHCALQ